VNCIVIPTYTAIPTAVCSVNCYNINVFIYKHTRYFLKYGHSVCMLKLCTYSNYVFLEFLNTLDKTVFSNTFNNFTNNNFLCYNHVAMLTSFKEKNIRKVSRNIGR